MSKKLKVFKDWKKILIFAITSITLSIIAYYFQNGFLKFINLVSWLIFTFYTYKGLFSLTNLLDLSNDLILWVLKIVGSILVIIGLFLGGSFFIGGLILNSDPLSMGLGTLLLGSGFLGVFMVFRTRRRHKHIYVNR